ncbi:hypothetical protein LZZ85_02665 [Terrimonas sp. NA20]|uniref:Uncharacterized protein n=1 Tax=Terrimonas ginsenosidimutans TaxID=2908004 RepID=A0ABS9KLF8_9BACT|nr:hypothetical protein [Terrimonas ginsenosidimutans]MCG2613158.1 hypothetical protein [Terrimonas ginsenosidimutans]
MKKLLLLGTIFTLFTVAASAQKGRDVRPDKHRFETGQLTRGERFKLHKNKVDYNRTERKFKRDGHMSRGEKRKLYKMKQHDRHMKYRFHHNNRKRS